MLAPGLNYERLFIGFGGLCLQEDPQLPPEALRKEFLNSRLTGPQSPSYQRRQRLTAANTMAIVVSPTNF